jgi:hypothetical protein
MANGTTQQSSRKRKLVQRDTSETREGQDSHYDRAGPGQRPIKQTARRGGKNGLRGAAAAFEPQNPFPPAFAPMSNMFNLANLPPPPPDPMPFDITDPMAFFTMMAALGTNMAGMPPLPAANHQGKGANGRVRQGRCHDYHEKGFCARGDMCAFQHDVASASGHVPEYDPDQPSLGPAFSDNYNKRQGPRNNGKKGGRTRAPFSMPGPSHDRTNTTLVVEQIPEEHFTEDEVQNFFSEFGTIIEVQLHAYKRLAIVKFEDNAAANQAYMSPKAVFENRFVKVYWHKKEDGVGASGLNYDDVDMADGENDYETNEEVLDPEEIARRQKEAQKAFEERRRKIEEAEAKSLDIDRQLREKDAEMRKIRRQLAELAGDDTSGLDEEYSQDLATLQAEAENLFAQKEPMPSAGRGRESYTPRGAHRGRVYAPIFRGRGAPRGGYRGRGRGAFAAPFPGSRSSVKRLDNRPRRLAVAGVKKGTPRDEALRQFLVVSHSTANVTFSWIDFSRTCPSAPALSHILKKRTRSFSPLISATRLKQ